MNDVTETWWMQAVEGEACTSSALPWVKHQTRHIDNDFDKYEGMTLDIIKNIGQFQESLDKMFENNNIMGVLTPSDAINEE